MKVNKKLKKQMVWVEDTRSVMLREDQKSQLCYLMDASQEVAEDGNLMAIAIEFRLKALVSVNSVASATTQGESKAYKQLKQDCAALVQEHPSQVCFTTDTNTVAQAGSLIFRQYNIEETGHKIN